MPTRLRLLCTLIESLKYSDRVHFSASSDIDPDAPTITGKLTIDVSSTNSDAPTFERGREYLADIVPLD